MSKPFSCLIPVLAILAALAFLGVPERAIAQDYCYLCLPWYPPDFDPETDTLQHYACRTTEGLGFQGCQLSRAGRQCGYHNDEPGTYNCLVVLDPAGRVYSAESPRRMQEVAPAANVLLEVARHGCTGAIIRRRYPPARITELRSDLRHVTI